MFKGLVTQIAPVAIQFAAIFGGIWLIKRCIRFFGPILKMRGKPWD